MKKYILLALMLSVSCFAQQKGITSEVPNSKFKIEPSAAQQLKGISNTLPAISVKAVEINKLNAIRNEESVQSENIDFTNKWQIIPAGLASVVKLNFTEKKLENLSVELGLGQDVLNVVATVPLWIQPALLDNLRRISPYRLSLFVNLIKNAKKDYVDEIAYQIGHLSPQTLNKINPQLLEVNVDYIYRIAPDLQYVELVEKGDADNWFTTTKYHILNDGNPEWVEIPKEIYYEYVLMPKLSDELPSMGADVYNRFWRDYVYNYADDGYPLLKNVITDVKYMWDLKDHKWINKDTADNKLPFSDSLFAVQTLGRWVAQNLPEKAKQPRPIQPNQILRDHNGNCGELEDLLNAGTRTALLPVRSVGSWPGDHVWNELWWDGHWYYYQVSWACGPTFIEKHHTYPHKGLISAWRADGYVEQINELYNPVCSLKIKVSDIQNKPVDGAEVIFFSATYHDTHADQFSLGSWQQTDENGELNVLLGNDITYGYRVDSKIGHNPLANNNIYPIKWNQLSEGGSILQNIKIMTNMPAAPQAKKVTTNPEDKYKIKIKFNLPYHILYGGSYWTIKFALDDHEWSDFRSPGHIDFYICNEENYRKYLQNLPFDAYVVHNDMSRDSLEFNLPKDVNYYLIFSNKDKLTVSQLLQTDVKLMENKGGSWEIIDSLSAVNKPTDINDNSAELSGLQMYVAPNPVNLSASISYVLPSEEFVELNIFDYYGRRIKNLYKGVSAEGINRIDWNLKDLYNGAVASGLYFVVLKTANGSVTRSVIVDR